MRRFDELIRSGMTVRDVVQRHPETAVVFEDFGFRHVCYDCTIETIARKHGLRPDVVILALNQAVYGPIDGLRTEVHV
ncbi:MAG: hypothetical protein ACK5AZ_23345 [Bryobacteraceae bacterium]